MQPPRNYGYFVGPKSIRNSMVPLYASMVVVDGQISTRPYFGTLVLFILVNLTNSNLAAIGLERINYLLGGKPHRSSYQTPTTLAQYQPPHLECAASTYDLASEVFRKMEMR